MVPPEAASDGCTPEASARDDPGSRSLGFILRSERWPLLLLFGIALVTRLVYALPGAEIPRANDMGVYDQLAFNILDGWGYWSQIEPFFHALRAPGYPFFLLVLYVVFGHGAIAVMLAQSLLGALTCVIVYLIGWEWSGRRLGALAASLCIVDPEFLHWTGRFLTETLFTCLVALLVLLCIRLPRSRGWTPTAVTGLVLGYATLVRPNLLLLVPFLVAYFLFCCEGALRRRLLFALLPPALCVLVLLPWTIRNYRVLGELVPVATIGGLALYAGLPPSWIGDAEWQGDTPDWLFIEQGAHRLPNGYDMAPMLMRSPRAREPEVAIDELEQSRLGREIFLRFVREEPGAFLRLVAMKASLTFNPLPKRYVARDEAYGLGQCDVLVRYYSMAFLLLLYTVGSYGLVSTFSWRGPAVLLAGVLLYHVAFQVVFRPALRYFLPGLVLASLFTAAGALALAERWREGSLRQALARRDVRIWLVILAALAANTWYQVVTLRGPQLASDAQQVRRLLGL